MSKEDEEANVAHQRATADYWNDWKERALAKSAGGMHRATKLKSGWQPTLAKGAEGEWTSSPAVILQDQAEELQAFWHAKSWAQEAWMPEKRPEGGASTSIAR